ncbi:putative Cytochrome P450 [Seiridium cardinale]|uniref:Cytochrome P450 n=1 Tax=Seiridium cardinale TaxID=138064 RepID=A0ABR2XFU8_9PEZI
MATISLSQALLVIVFIFILSSLVKGLYNITLHPLSRIPGPRLAGFSPIWLLFHTFSLRKCEALHDAHARYGPIVRIGPGKLLISSSPDIKSVYGIGSRFLKSDFYPPWGLDGSSNIFSTIDPRDHAVRRSITAKTFARNSIVQFLPQLVEHAGSMVKTLRRACDDNGGQTTIEFMKIARYIALDMLGSAVLGEDFQLLKTGREHPFVHDLDSATVIIPIRATLPSWLWTIAKRVPLPKWQHHLGGEVRLSSYAAETVDKEIRRTNKGDIDGPPTLVSSYAGYRSSDGEILSKQRIIGEIAAIYFAGTDTTSSTLTFALYELARCPEIQNTLRAELHTRPMWKDGDQVPAFSDLEENCPYLDAFIWETLRLYAAIPSHLERVVPAPGTTVTSGQHIPGGNIIGMQNYSLHRNEALFPNPEEFRPERWLQATAEMKKGLAPWGLGSRVCMGMHLAYIEMRLMLAAMIGNFEVVLPAGFDPATMRMRNLWFIFPQSGKLDIVVSAWNKQEKSQFSG